MRNAVILHGRQGKEEYFDVSAPAASNDHWIPWLQKQLISRKIYTQTPEIPDGWMPEYSKWKKEFERYDVSDESILVGHSCGGGFIVRWLSENKSVNPFKVILVDPWVDANNELSTDMFDFEIDSEIGDSTEMIVFSSDNDQESVQKSIEILKSKIKSIRIVEFHDKGHFRKEDLGTEAFTELLDEVLA